LPEQDYTTDNSGSTVDPMILPDLHGAPNNAFFFPNVTRFSVLFVTVIRLTSRKSKALVHIRASLPPPVVRWKWYCPGGKMREVIHRSSLSVPAKSPYSANRRVATRDHDFEIEIGIFTSFVPVAEFGQAPSNGTRLEYNFTQ
jgi:hypothetical protein